MGDVHRLPAPHEGHHRKVARLYALSIRLAEPGSAAGDEWDAWRDYRDFLGGILDALDATVAGAPDIADLNRRMDSMIAKAEALIEDDGDDPGPTLVVIDGGRSDTA